MLKVKEYYSEERLQVPVPFCIQDIPMHVGKHGCCEYRPSADELHYMKSPIPDISNPSVRSAGTTAETGARIMHTTMRTKKRINKTTATKRTSQNPPQNENYDTFTQHAGEDERLASQDEEGVIEPTRLK
jgi:hypothetical protein